MAEELTCGYVSIPISVTTSILTSALFSSTDIPTSTLLSSADFTTGEDKKPTSTDVAKE